MTRKITLGAGETSWGTKAATVDRLGVFVSQHVFLQGTSESRFQEGASDSRAQSMEL